MSLSTRWHSLDAWQVMKHLLFAVVVGVVTGFASIVLCLCVEWCLGLFRAHEWLLWALPVLGVLQLLLYRAFGLPGNLVTRDVVADIRDNRRTKATLAPGILMTTCMSVLGGGSVGKEAAALQMGASLGSLVGKPAHLKSVYRSHADEPMDGYAAATGMAACFAALFFAPIGAAVFVLELSRINRTVLRHEATILLACFVAFLISSFFGIGDVVRKVAVPAPDWGLVAMAVLVGLAAAVAGTAFGKAIDWAHGATQRVSRSPYPWVVAGGLVFALLVTAFGWQKFTGPGADLLDAALGGVFGEWDFAVKMLLTCVCLSFWLKGGEIMPSFCIGGLLGATCAQLVGAAPELGAAVGCMGFLAALTRCPLAAFFMGCEVFGWATAPFMGACVVAAMAGPLAAWGLGKAVSSAKGRRSEQRPSSR